MLYLKLNDAEANNLDVQRLMSNNPMSLVIFAIAVFIGGVGTLGFEGSIFIVF